MKKEYSEFRECTECGYDYAVNHIYPNHNICNDCDLEFHIKELRMDREAEEERQLEGNPLTVASKEVI